jgi:hypothetical protein
LSKRSIALLYIITVLASILITITISDNRWEAHLEVENKRYQQAGFIKGFYQGRYETCINLNMLTGQSVSKAQGRCIEAAKRAYQRSIHLQPDYPGWNWDYIRGKQIWD